MENTLTAAALKRRGMAAIEEGLRNGPIQLVKRNKATAVVLSAEDYQRLSGGQSAGVPGLTAMQWLLNLPATGGRSKHDLDAALAAERNW